MSGGQGTREASQGPRQITARSGEPSRCAAMWPCFYCLPGPWLLADSSGTRVITFISRCFRYSSSGSGSRAHWWACGGRGSTVVHAAGAGMERSGIVEAMSTLRAVSSIRCARTANCASLSADKSGGCRSIPYPERHSGEAGFTLPGMGARRLALTPGGQVVQLGVNLRKRNGNGRTRHGELRTGQMAEAGIRRPG